jgi:hypothetical protein
MMRAVIVQYSRYHGPLLLSFAGRHHKNRPLLFGANLGGGLMFRQTRET